MVFFRSAAVAVFSLLTACSSPLQTVQPTPISNPSEAPEPAPTTLAVEGPPALPEITEPITGRYNMVYDIERFSSWLVAGTQAGAVVWDTERQVVVAHHEEFICNSVQVTLGAAWFGCDKSVLRWDGTGWTALLENQENDADYHQLVLGPQGELFVNYGSTAWVYTPQGFQPTAVATGAGAYSVVFHEGGLWSIDFMGGLQTPNGFVSIDSVGYPGRDPRRLRVDARGQLWVEDFGAGLYRFDGQVFQHQPGVDNKGTGVAYDVSAHRLWLLHYTEGLVRTDAGVETRIDLSDMLHMRDLHLDDDGTMWVAGWRGIARIQVVGTETTRQDLRVPQAIE